MKYLFYIFLFVISFPHLALCQTYSLQGTIRTLNHRWTGTPIADVKVDVDSGKYIAKTDSNGHYIITDIPEGSHNIIFNKRGSRGFSENYTLNSNATLNVSLPDTLQTISMGVGYLNVSEVKEMLGPHNQNTGYTVFWPRDSVNITPVFFSRAIWVDSLAYVNEIGSMTNNWHDAKIGTIENVLQRKLFLPTADSIYIRKNYGYIIRFRSNNNATYTTSLDLENIPFWRWVISDVTSANPSILRHEVGRSERFETVSSRISIMNSNSSGIAMNLTDYIIYNFKLNYIDAMVRGEQDAKILNLINYLSPSFPRSPQIISPANNSWGVHLDTTIAWSNIFGADYYHLQIAKDSTFNSILVNDSMLQRIDRQIGALSTKTYFVRVRAMNDLGTSPWSERVSFTPVPFSPKLVSPLNTAFQQPLQTSFKWQRNEYADSSQIQIATDSLFYSTIKDTIVNSSDTTTSISGLQYFQSYYWRVRAKNIRGYSVWSDIWTFTTIDPPLAMKPVLNNPPNYSLHQPVDISLQWNDVNEVDSVHIQLAQDSIFTMIVKDTMMTAAVKLINIYGLHLDIKYYWRVRAKNIGGYSAWSDIWTFTTIDPPLLDVALYSVIFPPTVIGDSTKNNLIIKNNSFSPLTVISLTHHKPNYNYWQATPVVIPPNDSVQLPIRFIPTEFGNTIDTLTILSNGGSKKVILRGSSPIPVLRKNVNSLKYFIVARNKSKSLELKIYNISMNRLYVDSIYAKTIAFSVDKSNGNVGSDTLSVKVTFIPKSTGEYVDTLYLKNNSLTPLVTIPMSGLTPVPVITLSDSVLQFTERAIGDSISKILTIYNKSISPLTVNSITVGAIAFNLDSDSFYSPFEVKDSIKISIWFKPNRFGTISDTLSIVSDGGLKKIQLSGSSPYPVLVSNSPSLSYGAVARNSSKQLDLKVTNSSINTLIIDSIYTKTSVFAVDKNSGNVGTDTLSLNVSFSPIVTGSFVDTLYLRNNSTATLVKIPLSGSTPVPVLAISDTVMQFTDKAKGDSVSRVITIFNKSISPMTVNSLSVGTNVFVIDTAAVASTGAITMGRKNKGASKNSDGESFSVLNAPIGVLPELSLPATVKDSLKVRVWFKPDSFGLFTDTLSIVSDGGSKKIPLSGNSPHPTIISNHSTVNFDAVARNSSKQITIVLSNISINRLSIDSAYTGEPLLQINKSKFAFQTKDSLTITYAPIVYGDFFDTLYIKNNSANGLMKIPVSGGCPSPQIDIFRNGLVFSPVKINDSAIINITFTNSSPSAGTISKMTIGSYFSIPSDTLKIVPGNDSVIFPIKYKPLGYGTHNTNLIVETEPRKIGLEIEGSSPFPQLLLNSSFGDLGQVGVYYQKKDSAWIKNTSLNDLMIDSVSNKSGYLSTTLTKKLIKQNDSALIIGTFSSPQFGEFKDTISIANNSAINDRKIPIQATVPYPIISIVPSKIDFGIAMRDSVKENAFTIKNTSISNLEIDSLLTGTKHFDVVKVLANTIITQRDSAYISIRFKPDSIRAYNDTLLIFNTSKNNPAKIPLIGSGVLTGVKSDLLGIPDNYSLSQNYPNPFNPATTIRYGLPSASRVSLKIYNVLGQQIADLVNTEQSAGWYETTWSASVSSGLYFYRIDAVSSSEPNKRFTQLKKMILLK